MYTYLPLLELYCFPDLLNHANDEGFTSMGSIDVRARASDGRKRNSSGTGVAHGISTIMERSGPLLQAACHISTPCSFLHSSAMQIDSKFMGDPRSMSTNTKGANSGPPVDDSNNTAKGKSSTSDGKKAGKESTAANDNMRETLQEKQSNYQANFARVKDAPQPTKQTWWKPDPVTGVWVPEEYHGKVTTDTPTTKNQTRTRTATPASLEDRAWWTSMEELPDLDRKP